MFLPNWAAVPCRRALGNRKFRGQAMTAPPAIMGVALGYQETLEPNPSRAMENKTATHQHRATRPTAPADLETEMAEEGGSEMAGPARAPPSDQPYSF